MRLRRGREESTEADSRSIYDSEATIGQLAIRCPPSSPVLFVHVGAFLDLKRLIEELFDLFRRLRLSLNITALIRTLQP